MTDKQSATDARKKKEHCPRHDVWYGALEQCGACVGDPGPLPGEAPTTLPDPPTGCITSHDREAWFTKVATDALTDAKRVADANVDGDWHAEIAIKQHRDTGIKAMRAAGEIGAQRETDHLVKERQRGQVGGH